ncbi:MAG: PilZ domain-containing protein [Aromatoleum sp.]|jgi:type IV pilus assembly protein PilZ|uniref:PilZ domain-containing protein n=1 Tax=Aromatoleum sp. TaxID=2307007 RepID=UPI002894E55C|nr:PilZ domain-containing protein [Aromatoleum sp.]MDT3669066.1 PilZ domain-containing protein [Aromatoleum sp.]
MSEAKPSVARPSVLSLNINSKSALYAAYMPFLANGGIFVPTPRPHQLGDEVFMLLQLMDDPTKHPVAATVAWITPHGAQGGKTQGIGVHFSADESGKALRGRIEQILAGHLGSNRPTHTL